MDIGRDRRTWYRDGRQRVTRPGNRGSIRENGLAKDFALKNRAKPRRWGCRYRRKIDLKEDPEGKPGGRGARIKRPGASTNGQGINAVPGSDRSFSKYNAGVIKRVFFLQLVSTIIQSYALGEPLKAMAGF